MSKSLIIFDLDGTLYQSQHTSILSTKKGFSEFNLPNPSDHQITSLIGDTMESFCMKLVPHLSDEEITLLAKRISFYEKQLVWEMGKLFDGIEEMLKELKCRGYTLAICSNGSNEYIDTVLKACRITDIFDIIKGRHSEKRKADLIKDILCETKIEDAIVVGDTIYDIEAAHKNKLVCIGVTYGYGGSGISEADFTANSASELLCSILRLDIFTQIISDLTHYHFSSPYIIGVNGIDTSGKSIFANELHKYLVFLKYKTQLIHIDDFHNEYKIRTQGKNEIDSYIDYAFNYDLLENEILIPAKNGEQINKELLLLDLDSDSFINKNSYNIEKNTVIILEGVMLYRDPIDRYFDTRVFIDIDFETVLERAKIRDVPKYGKQFLDKYRKKYIPIQEKYIAQWSPREKSDYIINNADYIRPYLKKVNKKDIVVNRLK